jgi:hypothetical protein
MMESLLVWALLAIAVAVGLGLGFAVSPADPIGRLPRHRGGSEVDGGAFVKK